MRYHYERPTEYEAASGNLYKCDHPVYNYCTLYLQGDIGLAVIQQRFFINDKRTYWRDIDPWLIDDIYQRPGFQLYFDKNAGPAVNGCYPTVTVRQIMWALKMKPLKRQVWETTFDHHPF